MKYLQRLLILLASILFLSIYVAQEQLPKLQNRQQRMTIQVESQNNSIVILEKKQVELQQLLEKKEAENQQLYDLLEDCQGK